MNDRISRRRAAVAAVSTVAAATMASRAVAQTASPVPQTASPSGADRDEVAIARERLQRNSATLTKTKIAIGVEPQFRFEVL